MFGLGGSGLATVQSLLAGGAEIAAWDDIGQSRDTAAAAGVPLVDLRQADWSTFASLILAPGVPLTHPEPHWTVGLARAAGVEVIGDIEIFVRERRAHCPNSPFIAITGTNGKSTTTALITHVLRSAGLDAQMGGNIGRAILTLDPPAPDVIHVVEMSSFQIDLTPSLDPTVGVLLNVSADHLDRHGPSADAALAMRNYAAIKGRLVAGAQAACVGVEDEPSRAILASLEDAGVRTFPFTTGKGAAVVPRLYAIGSTLFVHEQHAGFASSTELVSLAGIGTLRGRHNLQNALAALAAISALQHVIGDPAEEGVRLQRLAASLATYPGLPHRMEQVGHAGRVVFVNDSKATNADSTEKALASWDRDIFWILGGKPKEGGIRPLEAYFPRIAKAYLIGAASDDFAATLAGKVPFERCVTLDVALASGRPRCGRLPWARARRPALAGLRQLRPVPLLRASRRHVPRPRARHARRLRACKGVVMLTRADRSLVAEWWFTVDRALLAVLLALIGIGMALSMAASPAVAIRKGLAPFHFAERQIVIGGLGMVVMLLVSALDPRRMRRLALAVLLLSIVLMAWALWSGPEIKGARRWVRLLGYSFQPSEIGKPALIVLVAWLFSEGAKRRDIPAMPMAIAVTVVFCGLLVIQPLAFASSLARLRCSAISERKPSSSTDKPGLGGHLERQIDREAVGVVQCERLSAGDLLCARRLDGARPRPRTVVEPEVRVLRNAVSSPTATVRCDRSRWPVPGTTAPSCRGRRCTNSRHRRRRRAPSSRAERTMRRSNRRSTYPRPSLPGLTPSEISMRSGARVVGDDAEADVVVVVGTVARPGQFLGLVDDRPSEVGLVDVVDALQQERDALDAHAGVDVLSSAAGRGSRSRPC